MKVFLLQLGASLCIAALASSYYPGYDWKSAVIGICIVAVNMLISNLLR